MAKPAKRRSPPTATKTGNQKTKATHTSGNTDYKPITGRYTTEAEQQ